jgi:hypothetical protein
MSKARADRWRPRCKHCGLFRLVRSVPSLRLPKRFRLFDRGRNSRASTPSRRHAPSPLWSWPVVRRRGPLAPMRWFHQSWRARRGRHRHKCVRRQGGHRATMKAQATRGMRPAGHFLLLLHGFCCLGFEWVFGLPTVVGKRAHERETINAGEAG